MYNLRHILEATAHRPWPLPEGHWRFYQEWNNALFLHWKVPEAVLRPLVPQRLAIDTLDRTAWVSLVAFTMQKIRPRYIPAFRPISEFHELNLRTYVQHDGKAGVYFLSIEAQKPLSAYLSRKLSGLPYVHSELYSERKGNDGRYRSSNADSGYSLEVQFTDTGRITAKTKTDEWLTERYCLYMDEGQRLYRFDTHHLPWDLHTADLAGLGVRYRLGDFDLSGKAPDLAHYAPGVKVLAWSRQEL